MPRYLIIATYTAEGAAGLLKDGGTGRERAVTAAVEGLGGRVESFDFALGEAVAYTVVDLRERSDAMAFALAVVASGTATTQTVPLTTPAEVDLAAQKTLDYRPAGG